MVRFSRQKLLMKLGTPRFTGQHYLASVATVKVILYRSCCEPCLLGTGMYPQGPTSATVVARKFLGTLTLFQTGGQILPTISAVAPKFSLWLHIKILRKHWTHRAGLDGFRKSLKLCLRNILHFPDFGMVFVSYFSKSMVSVS